MFEPKYVFEPKQLFEPKHTHLSQPMFEPNKMLKNIYKKYIFAKTYLNQLLVNKWNIWFRYVLVGPTHTPAGPLVTPS